MVETILNPQIVSAFSLLPIFGAVYKIYFSNPKIVGTKSVEAALNDLKTVKPEELGIGTYDVTPPTAHMNYTLSVVDDNEGDTVGILQVSDPYHNTREKITHDFTTGVKSVETVGPSNVTPLKLGTVVPVAEGELGGNQKFFGLIVCKKKGEQIFKSK